LGICDCFGWITRFFRPGTCLSLRLELRAQRGSSFMGLARIIRVLILSWACSGRQSTWWVLKIADCW